MNVMKRHGVRRLVVESAFGAGESIAQAGLLEKLVFATLLRAPYDDKNYMEPQVTASHLEWTLLRPTRLTDGPLTNQYTVTTTEPTAKTVSRADVAAAMLRAVEERLWIGEAPTVTGNPN